MRNIRLKIKGNVLPAGGDEEDIEVIEFHTDGTLEKKEGVIYLTYEESEVSGMPGCTTTLAVYGKERVVMSRTDVNQELDTVIEFQKGKRYEGTYVTPIGPIDMEVLTNSLENSVEEGDYGTIDIDYNVSLKGLSEGRSLLNVEIIDWGEVKG